MTHSNIQTVMTHLNVPPDDTFKCALWWHIQMCLMTTDSNVHQSDDTFKQIYSFLNIFSSLLSAFLMCQNFWFVPPGHYFYNVNARLAQSGAHVSQQLHIVTTHCRRTVDNIYRKWGGRTNQIIQHQHLSMKCRIWSIVMLINNTKT